MREGTDDDRGKRRNKLFRRIQMDIKVEFSYLGVIVSYKYTIYTVY